MTRKENCVQNTLKTNDFLGVDNKMEICYYLDQD
jgi:hypothetical protein